MMVAFTWITCNNNPIPSLESVYLSNCEGRRTDQI